MNKLEEKIKDYTKLGKRLQREGDVEGANEIYRKRAELINENFTPVAIHIMKGIEFYFFEGEQYCFHLPVDQGSLKFLALKLPIQYKAYVFTKED